MIIERISGGDEGVVNITSKQNDKYKLYKIKNNIVTIFVLINYGANWGGKIDKCI